MKKQLTILLLAVISFVSFSQQNKITTTNTVTFTADISGILGIGAGGAFDPYQDSLLVMGLDWDDSTTIVSGNRKMLNTDPFNPGLYTTTLIIQSSSDSLRWKFKASPDSRFRYDGWENGPYRNYIMNQTDSIVYMPILVPQITPFFGTLSSDLSLTIYLDMTYAYNSYNWLPIPVNEIEFIGIRGNEDFIGQIEGGCWCSDDTTTGHMKLLNHEVGNIWKFQTIVEAGTYIGVVEYKFGAMYPGADTINNGIQPLNNNKYEERRFILYSTNSITLFNYWHVTEVEKLNDPVPSIFQLEQNYPNPFNPSTKIRYSIPEYSSVTLKVFNLLGEEIETLFSGEQSAGVYEATFDASKLSSGIYFYTIQTDKLKLTKKMILMR